MAHKKKTPAAVATATGAKGSSRSTSTYHNKQHADNESIWNACRAARDADAALKAQAAARLEAAALALGFARNEGDGQWLRECPHCGRRVALGTTRDGDVRASGFAVGPTCAAIPTIQKWLP